MYVGLINDARIKHKTRKYFFSDAIPEAVKNIHVPIVETVIVSFTNEGYRVAIVKIIPIDLGPIYLNWSLLIDIKLEIIVEIPINKPKRKNANLEPNIVMGDRKIKE